jgi:hypothetical protein
MIPGMRIAKRTKQEIADAKVALNESFRRFKSVGQIAADTEFCYTVSELVRQIAVDEFALTDPTPLFVNRASASLGQTLEVEEVINTMKAVRRHPGGHPLAFTPTKRKFGISTKQYDLPFGMDLEKIIRRQLDPSVFAEHAAQALSRVTVSTVLGAIDAGATGADHYGRNLAATIATNVDQATLDGVLRSLGDVNSDVFIAGRYYALFPILGFTGFSEDMLNEIHAQGMIGRYKGAKVVVLKDDYNFYYNSASIGANKIYVGGGDKGAWLHERDVSALNYQSLDPERAWLKNGFRVDFGVTLLQPWKYRVITIT